MNKNRLLLYFVLTYCLGLYFGSIFYAKAQLILYLFFIDVIISVFLYIKGRKISCLIYLCAFFIGAYSSGSYVDSYKRQIESFAGKPVIISGQISGDINKDGNTARYILFTDTIYAEGKYHKVNFKISVIDYKNNPSYIKPFNTLTISGEFQGSSGYKNTKMQSYDDYLMVKGIWGSVVADYSPYPKSDISNRRLIAHWVYNTKCKAENIISKYLDNQTAILMNGVLFGDTGSMDDEQYDSFKRSGIVHVFAVSGYNIWLLYFILYRLLFFLGHRRKLKNYILVFLLFLYSLLSGWTPSVARAFITCAILLLGKAIGRETDPLTSLSLSALVILLPEPLYISDPGFQLSFLSVLSIILILPGLKKIRMPLKGKVNDILLGTTAVQIGIVPVISYHFNTLPVLSLVSNLVIVPVVSLFTICGIVLLILGILFPAAAELSGMVINMLGHIISKTAAYIGSLSFASVTVISPSAIDIIIYYILITLIFGIITVSIKCKSWVLCAAAMLIFAEGILTLIPGKLRINFIDVGQGDSILIITPDKKAVMIDGGGKPKTKYSDFDVGERVVKPYLLKHGIKKLDMVISTHSHDDHLLGLIPVLQSFNVKSFVMGLRSTLTYDDLFKNGGIEKNNTIIVSRGDLIQAGKDVKLYVLNPKGDEKDENDSSIVIRLEYKKFSVLFTGDISENIEGDIMNFQLQSNIIKIPHHGSPISLKQEFLDAVQPDLAVICVGRNTFGHPGRRVLDILGKGGIPVYRTDINGEVMITTNGLKYDISTVK